MYFFFFNGLLRGVWYRIGWVRFVIFVCEVEKYNKEYRLGIYFLREVLNVDILLVFR